MADLDCAYLDTALQTAKLDPDGDGYKWRTVAGARSVGALIGLATQYALQSDIPGVRIIDRGNRVVWWAGAVS